MRYGFPICLINVKVLVKRKQSQRADKPIVEKSSSSHLQILYFFSLPISKFSLLLGQTCCSIFSASVIQGQILYYLEYVFFPSNRCIAWSFPPTSIFQFSQSAGNNRWLISIIFPSLLLNWRTIIKPS